MYHNKYKVFKAIFIREWRRLCSRRIYFMAMIFIPIISMLSLISIMDEGLPKDMPIAVVDLDNTFVSRSLARQLDAMDQSKVVLRTSSFSEARKAMQRGELYAIIEIPFEFTKNLMSAKRPILHTYANNSFMMAGGLLYKDLKMISELAAAKVVLENNLARGKDKMAIMSTIQPIKVNTSIIGNPWLNYSMYLNNNLLAGILQILILQITVFSISIELKEKTAKEWLNSANNSISLALFGKLSIHTIIFFFVGLISLFILYGLESFTLMNGLLPMILLIFIFIISSQALGVFFVTLLPSPRLSLSLASLFAMLSFSMAAFSFPATAMYPIVRAFTYLFPLRYYNIIYIDQALTGNPFINVLPYYLALLFFAILVPISKRLLKRELLELDYIK